MTIRTECPRHKHLNGREAEVRRVLGVRHGCGAPILQLECTGDGAHFEAMLHEVLVKGKALSQAQEAKILLASGFVYRNGDWHEE